jgi:TrmH family RNA methyltransferase
MSSFLSRSRVVLVEPTLPENVGAVARAMNNMGVGELRLVNPCDYLSDSGLCVAAHSKEILQNAQCYGSLAEATADVPLVIGTTARRRDRFAEPVALPNVCQELPLGEGPVAIVFGRESSGLTNQELACCHQLVHIPTFGGTQSLNLAQAVIVFLYELSREEGGGAAVPDQPVLALSGEVEGLKKHLFSVLETVGFLREHQRDTLWQSFSDVIARARMASADVRLVRGFLRRTEITVRRASERSDDSASKPTSKG